MTSIAQHSHFLSRDNSHAHHEADDWPRSLNAARTTGFTLVTFDGDSSAQQTGAIDHQRKAHAHVRRGPNQWLNLISKIIREAVQDARKRADENEEDMTKSEDEKDETLGDINGSLMDLANTFRSFDPVGYSDFHNIHGEHICHSTADDGVASNVLMLLSLTRQPPVRTGARRRHALLHSRSKAERIEALLDLGKRSRAHNPIDEAIALRRRVLLDAIAKQPSATHQQDHLDELHMLNTLDDLHSSKLSRDAFIRDHWDSEEQA